MSGLRWGRNSLRSSITYESAAFTIFGELGNLGTTRPQNSKDPNKQPSDLQATRPRAAVLQARRPRAKTNSPRRPYERNRP